MFKETADNAGLFIEKNDSGNKSPNENTEKSSEQMRAELDLRKTFNEQAAKFNAENYADVDFNQLFEVYQQHNEKMLLQCSSGEKTLGQEEILELQLYENLSKIFYAQQAKNSFDPEKLQRDPIIHGTLNFFRKALENYRKNLMDHKISTETFSDKSVQNNYWHLSRKALQIFSLSAYNNLITDQKEKEEISRALFNQIRMFGFGNDKKYMDFKFLILTLVELNGVEKICQKLNNAIVASELKNISKDSLEYAYSLIVPNGDKVAIRNLQKFYQEKIKFEDYKVNQEMNESEVALLQSLIQKDEKVLEEGCGTGRLLLEMKKAGYDITGFDFTGRHVDIVKEQDAEVNVIQGDWHKTEYADESFDAVYSLGRNVLHDYSIVDQTQLFREANRVLKPGGKFIFDIPDRGKGGYKMMVEEYANEMKERGIRNFRYGTIYDSPDGKNFATRYAFSHEDIEQLAQLTGFEIKEVRKEELKTSKGDENLYHVLIKK